MKNNSPEGQKAIHRKSFSSSANDSLSPSYNLDESTHRKKPRKTNTVEKEALKKTPTYKNHIDSAVRRKEKQKSTRDIGYEEKHQKQPDRTYMF